MKDASPLERIKGRTIEKAEISRQDGCDSCAYAVLDISFTDGSMINVQFTPRPLVEAIFFRDSSDEGAERERVLVKP